MTIETSKVSSTSVLTGSYATQPASSVAAASPSAATTGQPTPSPQVAAQVIQSHLSGNRQPPQFEVDYLSGLDVMKVRASGNGEVLFQIPGEAAVRLAQLLHEGAAVGSFGIVDQTA
jgi:hypothetical protein